MTTKEYDFTIFIIENLSPVEFLNLEIDLNDSIRIRNSRTALSTFDCVPPRHRQIIFLVEWANKVGEKAKLEYIYRSQHVKQARQSIPEIFHNQHDFHSFRPF